MKKQTNIMGMPVTICITDKIAKEQDILDVFAYLDDIDKRFSTYKSDSEVTKINNNIIHKNEYSDEMKMIIKLCEQTKQETKGYFDCEIAGRFDPSGIVKGFAIFQAATILQSKGCKNFFINIAGDIQVSGTNDQGNPWRVGIENPFNPQELIKIIYLKQQGIATSGRYKRGNHIYNPIEKKPATEVASVTIIGPNVYEADRFATAVFAMGEKRGLLFLESHPELEGYMITNDQKAYATTGLSKYLS